MKAPVVEVEVRDVSGRRRISADLVMWIAIALVGAAGLGMSWYASYLIGRATCAVEIREVKAGLAKLNETLSTWTVIPPGAWRDSVSATELRRTARRK